MMRESLFVILGLLVVTQKTLSQVTDDISLVVSSTTSKTNVSKEANNDEGVIPKIYEMRIDCNVSNRFAKSLITSKVKNLDKTAHEAVFAVVIPDQAFISGFVMEIDGKSYEAYVQEKETAKKTYEAAVASGQSAGHVAVSARDSNRFTVSVNIEPQMKVKFYLKYEELLSRVENKYQIVLNIHPGQPVQNLEAKVQIAESRPLKFVKTPSLKTGNEISKENESLNPNAHIENINETSTVVTFNPNIEKQKQYASALGTEEDKGFAGQFIVEYDVERDPQGGEVLVNNGYFVHFFGSDDLVPLPKQVVFVLDTSGSMSGIRISQLKEAMKSILSELKEEDVFNIVEFNSIAKVWNVDAVAVQYESGPSYWYDDENNRENENPFKNRTSQPIPSAYAANEKLIKKAEQVVDKLVAIGGTDIETALKVGIQVVENNVKRDKKHQPIIIFLTDGEPTVGETSTEKIIRTISELNVGKTSIFSLSFGDEADRKFLEKISLKNFGFARHIYEAADASLQLKKFYKQISSPLLSDVTFKYVSNVTSVTKAKFPIFFGGSELVVAGIADEGFKPPTVEGLGINGPVVLIPHVETAVSSIERLWAYLTLKQILEQREQADNKTGPTQEALRIALKYSFVSDVSSLVVVKPNQTDAVETEDGSKSDKFYPIVAGGLPGLPLSLRPSLLASSSSANFRPMMLFGDAVYGHMPTYSSLHHSINRHMYLTTPHLPRPLITTTAKVTQIPDVDGDDEIETLKKQLPWFISVLNSNRTISLSTGIFDLLGLNTSTNRSPECDNSVSNNPGDCVLIYKCPQIFPKIQSLEGYEKHFCNLNGHAGVCCPRNNN